jgi:hypothetical protein
MGAVVATGISAQTALRGEEKPAAFDTTRVLYRVCAVPAENPNYVAANLACSAFIEATVQYHYEVSRRKGLKPLFCYPEGTTVDQAKQTFVSWAATHGDDQKLMDELPVVGLVRSLAERYPCKA